MVQACDRFRTTSECLLTISWEKKKNRPNLSGPILGIHPAEITFAESRYAPILGTIPGGLPVLAVEDIQGYASIPYRDNEDYFLPPCGRGIHGRGLDPHRGPGPDPEAAAPKMGKSSPAGSMGTKPR